MKKLICGALSVALAACCLTACAKTDQAEQSPDPEVGEPASAVTDFVVGDVEVHEPLLPWQFEEGEEVENPYFKRTTDENGTNVYAVLKASNNQVAYLPMSNTVVYMGGSENCFFERTTNTYKMDGEDQTVVQFQLYVSDVAPESESVANENAEGEPELALNNGEADSEGVSVETETGLLAEESGSEVEPVSPEE